METSKLPRKCRRRLLFYKSQMYLFAAFTFDQELRSQSDWPLWRPIAIPFRETTRKKQRKSVIISLLWNSSPLHRLQRLLFEKTRSSKVLQRRARTRNSTNPKETRIQRLRAPVRISASKISCRKIFQPRGLRISRKFDRSVSI